MTDRFYIGFDFEESGIIVSVRDEAGNAVEEVVRGRDSIASLNSLSNAYRVMVVHRSFAAEDDPGIIQRMKDLGSQLYSLFFAGLESVLANQVTLVLEHHAFFVPLELAFDGQEFVGTSHSIGNQIKGHVSAPAKVPASERSGRGLRVLFLGEESRAVVRLFERDDKVSLCDELRGTRSDVLLKRLRNTRYDLLHFACHGQFHCEEPDKSFLLLDYRTSYEDESVVFSLRELEQAAALTRPLVVLNSCQSGIVSPDYRGFVGFAERLLGAGSRACIATSWSIGETGAARFAGQFYALLLQGVPVGEILRRIRQQCWIEQQDILTAFSYVLFGDPAATVGELGSGREVS